MDTELPDYSGFTCTSLMIRLKIDLGKLPARESLEFIIRRDQLDTIEGPFSADRYIVTSRATDGGGLRVTMKKAV